jgi:hypothetical protein
VSDPASLQNLHDIVVPAPVDWWPPAPGWYLLAAVLAVALLLLAVKGWRHWRRNRYRGEALKEIARLRRAGVNADLQGLPELLKRAALSAWPRAAVAGLTGPDWHRFLDAGVARPCFCGEVGPILDRLAYGGEPPGANEVNRALDAAEAWLKQHKVPEELA